MANSDVEKLILYTFANIRGVDRIRDHLQRLVVVDVDADVRLLAREVEAALAVLVEAAGEAVAEAGLVQVGCGQVVVLVDGFVGMGLEAVACDAALRD